MAGLVEKYAVHWVVGGAGLLLTAVVIASATAGPPAAYLQEHVITKTTEARALKLKPGKYKFMSFTFDFPFGVNLDGKVEYAASLDQCVGGRGTQTLTIRCSRTYPYGGQRDYQY